MPFALPIGAAHGITTPSAARLNKPHRDAEIFGAIGEHVKAVPDEDGGGFDESHDIGCSVRVGDDFELDPGRAEQFVRSFAVVTASRKLLHPAVFGSTVTSSSRISTKGVAGFAASVPAAATQRRSGCRRGRMAPCIILGDGYSAVPISSREENSRS